MLSRLSVYSDQMELEGDDESEIMMASIGLDESVSLQDLVDATIADQEIQSVKLYMDTKWPAKRNQVPENLRAFFDLKGELDQHEGVIYRDENRIVVPAELRKKLIQLAHEGHPGIDRTKRRLRDSYWWPKMYQEVDTFVRHCSPCQASGKSSKPEQVPVTAVPPP